MVRSVRAAAGSFDPKNPTEGNYTAFLEFENGIAATLIYDGYGYFDDREITDEAVATGSGKPGAGQRLRRARAEGLLSKEASRSGLAFEIEGRGDQDGERQRQPFFGLTVVSCELGVLRQSPQGIFVYEASSVSEVPCAKWEGPLKVELEDFREAVTTDKPVPHDGRWGKATLEVCLAILQSNQERREVNLAHQVPSPY